MNKLAGIWQVSSRRKLLNTTQALQYASPASIESARINAREASWLFCNLGGQCRKRKLCLAETLSRAQGRWLSVCVVCKKMHDSKFHALLFFRPNLVEPARRIKKQHLLVRAADQLSSCPRLTIHYLLMVDLSTSQWQFGFPSWGLVGAQHFQYVRIFWPQAAADSCTLRLAAQKSV